MMLNAYVYVYIFSYKKLWSKKGAIIFPKPRVKFVRKRQLLLQKLLLKKTQKHIYVCNMKYMCWKDKKKYNLDEIWILTTGL